VLVAEDAERSRGFTIVVGGGDFQTNVLVDLTVWCARYDPILFEDLQAKRFACITDDRSRIREDALDAVVGEVIIEQDLTTVGMTASVGSWVFVGRTGTSGIDSYSINWL